MKIMWAFDPFQTDKEQQQFAARILRSLSNSKDELIAIYVASNAEAELATAFSIPASKRYTTYPKKVMTAALKKLNLKKIKPEVLSEKSLSMTAVAKQITDYTKKKKTDLLLIATNNKKFLPRLIFGSFAESIIHLSNCDLFIFHQRTKFKEKTPARLLYANDLTAKGALGLERAITYAKKWNAELAVVHIPLPEAGMTLNEFKEVTQKKVAKLEQYLVKQKVNYQIYLEYDVKPTSETLLEMAEKTGADLIAVAAQAKKLEAFLGGSITRQILRASKLPTLVLKV